MNNYTRKPRQSQSTTPGSHPLNGHVGHGRRAATRASATAPALDLPKVADEEEGEEENEHRVNGHAIAPSPTPAKHRGGHGSNKCQRVFKPRILSDLDNVGHGSHGCQRVSKSRLLSDLDNVGHGRVQEADDEGDDPASYANGDSRRARVHKEHWHSSEAYQMVAPSEFNTGLWIPRWIVRACGGNARYARVLAYVIWRFEPAGVGRGKEHQVENIDDDYKGLCGARYFYGDHRWLATSIAELAAECLLPRRTVDRGLSWLKTSRLLVTSADPGRLLVRPNVLGIARAYADVTRDRAVADYVRQSIAEHDQDEQREGEQMCIPGWHESGLHEYVFDRRRAPGVYVTDRMMLACGRDAATALVLSQICWHHARRQGKQLRKRPRRPRRRLLAAQELRIARLGNGSRQGRCSSGRRATGGCQTGRDRG